MKPNPQSIASLSPEEKRKLLADLLKKDPEGRKTAPLSFAQKRLWFVDQMEPGNPAFNITLAFRLMESFDLQVLEAVLKEMSQRHQTLRTFFSLHGDHPIQVIRPSEKPTLILVDLESLSEEDQKAKIGRLIAEAGHHKFDLSKGPLFLTHVLRIAPSEAILIFVMHHIVTDEWSNEIFLKEFVHLYGAFTSGQPSSLSPLPIQYADFAAWQQNWLQGTVRENLLGYWKNRLDDLSTFDFPTDYPRPRIQSFKGASETFSLSGELKTSLLAVAQKEKATLFMTLLTALMIVLSRNSGNNDVVVGTPIAGRNRPEVEGLIGFFVNMLVLRSNLSGNLSLRELLNQVRGDCLGAYSHQDCPFELLVEELQPQRDLSRHPIFQISFSLQKDLQTNPSPSLGLKFQPVSGSVPHTRFDLECLVQERQEALLVNILYNPDLFSAMTATRIGQNFHRILAEIARDPEQRLSEVSLLDEHDRHVQLVEWNTTTAAYPHEHTIPDLFAEQVGARPGAVAVVDGVGHYTYSQLQHLALQLAHYLRRQGVGPESRVGVCQERGVDLMVSLLAILSAGGAYVPLDPSLPAERLAFLVKDAGVQVVVTHQAHVLQVAGLEGISLVVLDRSWASIRQEPTTPVPGGAGNSAALAYVMYTSGSTGQPKGTLISQRNVVRLVRGTNYLDLGPKDRVGHLANPAFDAITFEVWGPLLNGGVAVVFHPEEVLNPSACAKRLREERLTGLFLTTALFNQLGREESSAFAHVGTVLFGGELVDRHWVGRVLQSAPPRRLRHVYGPTESTTFATWHEVEGVKPEEKTVPIGRPLANTQVYVVDRWHQLVPVGVQGELVIGGEGLAWGYLQQPGLTAEKFVPHPFCTEPGARVYRTGDHVRWNHAGALEFQGRQDGQVKVRGYRIELGEIEATLTRYPAVQEAVVLCREETPGGKELVAYVVTPTEEVISGLRTYLKQQLPVYMVPSVFVRVEIIPLTPNGKVDKRALPAPANADRTQGLTYVAPETVLEELLTTMWKDVLKLEKIGIHDNFFDLGGHSLLATQVMTRLRTVLELDIPLRTFFEHPTIQQLGQALDKELTPIFQENGLNAKE